MVACARTAGRGGCRSRRAFLPLLPLLLALFPFALLACDGCNTLSVLQLAFAFNVTLSQHPHAEFISFQQSNTVAEALGRLEEVPEALEAATKGPKQHYPGTEQETAAAKCFQDTRFDLPYRL